MRKEQGLLKKIIHQWQKALNSTIHKKRTRAFTIDKCVVQNSNTSRCNMPRTFSIKDHFDPDRKSDYFNFYSLGGGEEAAALLLREVMTEQVINAVGDDCDGIVFNFQNVEGYFPAPFKETAFDELEQSIRQSVELYDLDTKAKVNDMLENGLVNYISIIAKHELYADEILSRIEHHALVI